MRCVCDVEVLHGYCPSQPNSIKCCPKSTEGPDDGDNDENDNCDDDVDDEGEDCSQITCKKGGQLYG